jgi:hypothetical protein
MNTTGPYTAWDILEAFLAAEFSQAPRHLRRLGKVAALEPEVINPRAVGTRRNSYISIGPVRWRP